VNALMSTVPLPSFVITEERVFGGSVNAEHLAFPARHKIHKADLRLGRLEGTRRNRPGVFPLP
jgi:hypothetical protein